MQIPALRFQGAQIRERFLIPPKKKGEYPGKPILTAIVNAGKQGDELIQSGEASLTRVIRFNRQPNDPDLPETKEQLGPRGTTEELIMLVTDDHAQAFALLDQLAPLLKKFLNLNEAPVGDEPETSVDFSNEMVKAYNQLMDGMKKICYLKAAAASNSGNQA